MKLTPVGFLLAPLHCAFPAYEVYINGRRVHEYSPIPEGWGPLGLFRFNKTFDNSGDL